MRREKLIRNFEKKSMENTSIRNDHMKATRSFWIIFIVAFLLISIILWQSLFFLKGVVDSIPLAYKASICTGDICTKCLFSPEVLKVTLICFVFGILYTGVIVALYRSCVLMRKDYQLMNDLSYVSINNNPQLKNLVYEMGLSPDKICLFQNENLRCAFTGGIIKPRIFLSTGLSSYLSIKELRMVVLHELYHLKENGPLKNYLVSVFGKLLFFVPFIKSLVKVYSEFAENAADDYAVDNSTDPVDLAGTLLKMGRAVAFYSYPVSTSPISGFQNLEKRIRRLVDNSQCPAKNKICFSLVLNVIFCLLLLVAVSAPIVIGSPLKLKEHNLKSCLQRASDDNKVCHMEHSNKCCKS